MVESKIFCFITNSNELNLPLFIVLHQTVHSQDIINYNNPFVQDKPRQYNRRLMLMVNMQDGVCHNWGIPGNYYVGAFLNYDKNNEKFHYTYTLTFFKFKYSTLAVTTDELYLFFQTMYQDIYCDKKVDIGIRCIHFPTSFFIFLIRYIVFH